MRGVALTQHGGMVKTRMIGVIEAAPERKRTLELDSVSRDKEVRDRLIVGYLPLVHRLCRRFSRYGEPMESSDREQEAH